MSAQHSTVMRGLAAAGRDPNFQGRFGRLFPGVPAARFGNTADEEKANLAKLAGAMISDFDPPKDGPDDEESGIPALYTYLGQFIDHDLTFDPDGSFQKQKDPDATTDFRTPAFDLDNVYGRGPGISLISTIWMANHSCSETRSRKGNRRALAICSETALDEP